MQVLNKLALFSWFGDVYWSLIDCLGCMHIGHVYSFNYMCDCVIADKWSVRLRYFKCKFQIYQPEFLLFPVSRSFLWDSIPSDSIHSKSRTRQPLHQSAIPSVNHHISQPPHQSAINQSFLQTPHQLAISSINFHQWVHLPISWPPLRNH